MLAYLGERDHLLRFISRKAEGCYAPTLPEHIAMEYYCVPLWEIARGIWRTTRICWMCWKRLG